LQCRARFGGELDRESLVDSLEELRGFEQEGARPLRPRSQVLDPRLQPQRIGLEAGVVGRPERRREVGGCIVRTPGAKRSVRRGVEPAQARVLVARQVGRSRERRGGSAVP
jgi:hypothetical protein